MRTGPAGRLAHAFLDSRLTPLLIAVSLGLGALALLFTPREEEPQIRVPMIDVAVALPGAAPDEVMARVVEPLERAFWSLSRVEHVYSTAQAGQALITVRFLVNESNEESLVKVYERLTAVGPTLPREASPPAVELHSIDDVPFLTFTLWSAHQSSDTLRPLAQELAQELSEIPDTSKAYVIGGAPRVVRVLPDIERLAAAQVSWATLTGVLQSASGRVPGGSAVSANRELRVEAGARLRSADDVARVVVGVRAGRPLYVADVAQVVDGPDEAVNATFFIPGAARAAGQTAAGREYPAVTVALAKRPGANATELARAAHAKLEALRPRLLPADVQVDTTRDYGRSAAEKSNELVEHLLIATLSVVALISLAMGWRSGLVVGIAVPVTLALTLFIYFLAGYTLNRVTLFALIFSIGILVDDAIVVVENIERHHREKPNQPLWRTAVEAVDEVGNPTILATVTVIAAILPMAFVRGLMGPYMQPIPTGASAAMVFSLIVAFVVSPWAALRVFRGARSEFERHPDVAASDAGHAGADESQAPPAEAASTRLYRRVMTALITRSRVRLAFFGGLLIVLAASIGLVVAGQVRVKMLPFDNKSEFQVLVDHDEGTPLEVTLETARQLARHLAREVPEVADVQLYAGHAAPYNFNGLVRHYFLRRAPQAADLQVNLVSKHARTRQSHDLAKAVRPELQRLGRARGARVKIVEIPPGPPVLDTLVAEIYGPSAETREALAGAVRHLFDTTAGVVDVDDSLAAQHPRWELTLDRERVALAGLSPAVALEALAGPGAGRDVAQLDLPAAREPVPVRVRLTAADRAHPERRLALRVDGVAGPASLALAELAEAHQVREPQALLHKDLKPVVYVFGDLAGVRESPVYALAELNRRLDALRVPSVLAAGGTWRDRGALTPSDAASARVGAVQAILAARDGQPVERLAVQAPETSDRPALKWDGEWQITYEVFRDLGLAFAVVLALIAVLVIGWFQSFKVPLAILLPVPLSLIGILPGHWAFGAFFTATSMIGFIAGAGIIVRNSIILVDFIELKLRQGRSLDEAVVEAGAVRFRPMLLTAAAVVAGSFVILFDPIFQGLALSLMMGEVAATFLSRLAVPVVYHLLARGARERELHEQGLMPAV